MPETSAFGQFSQAGGQVGGQPGGPQSYYGQQAPQAYAQQGPGQGPYQQGAYQQPAYQASPEPSGYSTQGGQPSPAAYGASAGQEPAGYRVRDFSPGGSGRRSSAQPLVEPPAYAGYPSSVSDLDYHTQGLPVVGYAAAGGASSPSAAGQPSSRREQRRRQSEEELRAGSAGGQMPYNAALLAQSQPQPMTASGQYPAAQLPHGGYPSGGHAPAGYAPPPQQPGAYPTGGYPAAAGQPAGYPGAAGSGHSASHTTLSSAVAEFDTLSRNRHPDPSAYQRIDPQGVVQGYLDPALEQTGGWVAPVGHWSRQADLDDETQPWEGTLTREVGGGNVATTTNALVLPEIPRPDPFATALASTGEVLLTGSIDLPRSLGSRGGDTRRYDDPGVDRMFDTQDAEFTGTDSSPVRAIRAVSTHPSARGVIHTNKSGGNRLLIAVFVGTAVLAVAVVAMLAASLASGLF